MPRPGFVLEVDERTPPLLVHEGEQRVVGLERRLLEHHAVAQPSQRIVEGEPVHCLLLGDAN